MAAGDETILGPYSNNPTGWSTMDTELTAVGADLGDKYVIIPDAGNINFAVIHIAGA